MRQEDGTHTASGPESPLFGMVRLVRRDSRRRDDRTGAGSWNEMQSAAAGSASSTAVFASVNGHAQADVRRAGTR